MVARIFMIAISVAAGALISFTVADKMPFDKSAGDRPLQRAAAPASKVKDKAQDTRGWSTEISAARDGHFYIEGIVNAARVRFVVDTGATSVALSQRDAERIGLRLTDRNFNMRVSTAGGLRRAARVTLATIRIDDNWVYNIPAVVVEGYDGVSLLGLSFLRQLEYYEFTDRVLTLHW